MKSATTFINEKFVEFEKEIKKITNRQKAWAKKTVKQLEAETQECSVEILRNFAKLTGKHMCQSLFFNRIGGLRPETQTQVFSCEFCKISKSTFSYRTPPVAASGQFLTKRLEQLDAVLDRLEQCSRCNWLLIHGVDEIEGEDSDG